MQSTPKRGLGQPLLAHSPWKEVLRDRASPRGNLTMIKAVGVLVD